VEDVVVAACDDGHGDRFLAAYLVARAGASPGVSGLRSHLRERLPEFMVPSAYVFLEALPVTASGKVDRRALPAPEAPAEAEAGYAEPRTPAEERVAGIWAQVLGVERVGIYTSFFDLGGHSLLATQIISRVREAFQVDLALRSLFETPTVAGMMLAIAQAQVGQEDEDDVARLLAELEQLSDDEARDLLTGESQPGSENG
jgi:acyl carrier protein